MVSAVEIRFQSGRGTSIRSYTRGPGYGARRGGQRGPSTMAEGFIERGSGLGSTMARNAGHSRGPFLATRSKISAPQAESRGMKLLGRQIGGANAGKDAEGRGFGLSRQGAECFSDLDVACGESCRHVRKHYNEPSSMTDDPSGAVQESKSRRW